MTLGRIIAPYWQIQDYSGKNNTRGLMYVYLEPNTTTRATLYSESNHETLTNPLTINDIGQVEDFVVDSSYKYWIYVTDLDNNKLFDRHDLSPLDLGEGTSTEYYAGNFINIDSQNKINVDPTKKLAFEYPLTVNETDTEMDIGLDNSYIGLSIKGKNGITATKKNTLWTVDGSTLKTWQDNHGKTLTINGTSFDGTSDVEMTIESGSSNFTPNVILVPSIAENLNSMTIYQNSDYNQLGLYYASENRYGQLYTIPSYSTSDVDKVLTVGGVNSKSVPYLEWKTPESTKNTVTTLNEKTGNISFEDTTFTEIINLTIPAQSHYDISLTANLMNEAATDGALSLSFMPYLNSIRDSSNDKLVVVPRVYETSRTGAYIQESNIAVRFVGQNTESTPVVLGIKGRLSATLANPDIATIYLKDIVASGTAISD